MKDSNYLTIEETAKKLGRPASWVKDQICEGKLGATLTGRQWLISRQDFDELLLNNPPPDTPRKVVHNFLPDRPKVKPQSTRKDRIASKSAQRSAPARRSKESSPPARERRSKKGRGRKPTLTQRIEELDRRFDRLSVQLESAMLDYRAAIRSGKKVDLPSDLLGQWKSAKAELKHLIAKAHAKGLSLPANLRIYKVLAQEAGFAKQKTVAGGKVAVTKSSTKIKGIDGYYSGPSREDTQETRRVPAQVEARLIILRNRERAAAHDMQDRGKSRAARDASATVWAQARREAERLKREHY